ncbi:MAG: hypothetical protein QF412_14840 [Planctomycetota bacterium]|jgi:hypothetical protein|nr:hypothetical protein [Planctomycetota bacterium]
MSGLRCELTPFVLLGVLGGCASSPGLDLATNERLFRPPNYQVKIAADRPVTILPVVDARGPLLPDGATRSAVVEYMPESLWVRSIPEMLGDVVQESLTRSRVFAEALPGIHAEACLLRIEILDFHAALVERVTGRNTFASVRLGVRVHGPIMAGGERPVWFEQEFGDHQVSEVGMIPPATPVLLGRATYRVIAQMLASLDQSNVARTGVPRESDR